MIYLRQKYSSHIEFFLYEAHFCSNKKVKYFLFSLEFKLLQKLKN